MLKAKSLVYKSGGRTLYISIPAAIASDSQCPIKAGDVVDISILGKQIRIQVSKSKSGIRKSRNASEFAKSFTKQFMENAVNSGV